MQSPPLDVHRPGRKPYPLSSNQRRDEHAEDMYVCGLTPRSIMLAINREAATKEWPPVRTERHIRRIIYNQQLKKRQKLEWSYDESDAAMREATLARMDHFIQLMVTFLYSKTDWVPFEYQYSCRVLMKMQIQQARNRGYLAVPFKVQWKRVPRLRNQQTRMIERTPVDNGVLPDEGAESEKDTVLGVSSADATASMNTRS